MNRNVLNVGASATIMVADKARELKEKGLDVISFAVGEPDFDTPENIKNAAKDALDDGYTKYTDLKGIKPLREKICEKLLKDNNIKYTPDEIIVSNGAKHSLFNALYAITDRDEEILIITPAWVSYVEQIKLIGGKPVIIESNDDFSLPLEKIEKAINSKTRAILINTPCNPTGSVYTEEELRKLADIVVKHKDFYVISDEIYEKIIYKPNKHFSIASISKELKERTIVINGFSKAYAMTGWRMGYSASNKEIAKLIARIQSHMTSCPNSISQYSSLVALDLDSSDFDKMVQKFEKRKNILLNYFNNKEKLKLVEPNGAFYFFVDFSAYIGKKVKNSLELSMFLLEKYHIALTAGSAFFKENHLRMSYATSEENILKGLKRMDKALEELGE
jgi:aspartate aminotransferase